MDNIDATMRELSVCLDAAASENDVADDGNHDVAGCDHTERSGLYEEDTSASLADQMSGFSTDTPTSLTVSFDDDVLPSHQHQRQANSRNLKVRDFLSITSLVFGLVSEWGHSGIERTSSGVGKYQIYRILLSRIYKPFTNQDTRPNLLSQA